jgi:uncharacterized repeat protein (TIGR03806 family)
LEQRPTLSGLTFPTQSVQTSDIAVVRAFPNLSFSNPLYITAAPADANRLFVVTQSGVIYVFDNNPATTSARVFLDINDRVTDAGGETGLLGLAFDPDYATNGYFYVNYNPNFDSTGANPLRTVIARFHVTADPNVADAASEMPLLTYNQPFANHNGGWLGFGPDRKLYIAAGDGGGGGDPNGNGQNLNTPLGKILRINSDGSIPADNPFVGQSGRRGEIWAYGMRNPYRDSFDRATGLLWSGDVGQNAFEEIDVIQKGGNFGWNVREGLHGYPDPNTPKPPGNNFIDPVAEYDHGSGCSVTGGYVYRGGAVPSLGGVYLYTDYCAGTLWALTQNNGVPGANRVIGQIPGNPTSFGEDAAGELYATSFNGNLYTLVPNGSGGSTFPQKLSQTGLFTNTAGLIPNPGLIGYDINAPFWSDGAAKRRWIGVPNVGQILFNASTAWTFPVGTVTVKQFDITLANGDTRRLETRVFVNQADGWQGYTYKWNSAGTDADLLSAAQTEVITVAGGASQTYEFPSRAACATCHNAAAGFVLGVGTAQMNRTYGYPLAVDNELRTLNHIALFTTDIGAASQYPQLTDPLNTTAALSARARAYLETNCAHCHRPGGPTPVNMDLRRTTPIATTNTLDILPTAGDLGLANARRIAPGHKESSVVWERMRRLDGFRMPNLASHVVDPDGVALIGQWIDAGAQ